MKWLKDLWNLLLELVGSMQGDIQTRENNLKAQEHALKAALEAAEEASELTEYQREAEFQKLFRDK